MSRSRSIYSWTAASPAVQVHKVQFLALREGASVREHDDTGPATAGGAVWSVTVRLWAVHKGYLLSRAVAALSRKALKALIWYKAPPLSALEQASAEILLTMSSKLASSASLCSAAASSGAVFPLSTARSISCMSDESLKWRCSRISSQRAATQVAGTGLPMPPCSQSRASP